MTVVNVADVEYYINKKLKDKWDKIRESLIKRDEDRVFIVDGRERTGKSVFTIQQAAYINPTVLEDKDGKLLPWICFTADEFLEAIRTAPQGQVIIFDEAFRGLSSRGALSKTNKKIVQALMEMGQKNLVVFIVSPSFFMLDLYAAMLRSNALFHVEKEKGSNKRYFKVYNYKKKAKLYQHGVKKGWEYKIPTKFKDYFFNIYPGGKDFEERYRRKKKISLETMDMVVEDKPENDKYLLQRDILINYIKENITKSERKTAKLLNTLGIALSNSSIHVIASKSTENTEKSLNA